VQRDAVNTTWLSVNVASVMSRIVQNLLHSSVGSVFGIWREVLMESSHLAQSLSNSTELEQDPSTYMLNCLVPMHLATRGYQTKRIFDVTIAVCLIILALPVFLLIMLVLCCEEGPVFFSHKRIGLGGRNFDCLKFRTMFWNSDKILAEKLASDPAALQEWDTKRKLVVDPRITKIGRILRKTSLDELPQLLNVIKGDMSLVGPRPIVWEEAKKYGEDFKYYVAVRPGITGLWQVSGRSNTTFAQRVALDRSYVSTWGLRYDVIILLKTIPALLARDGAY
jgi:Undecaprenyl-phosphate galactose phosphotransferase WbaP